MIWTPIKAANSLWNILFDTVCCPVYDSGVLGCDCTLVLRLYLWLSWPFYCYFRDQWRLLGSTPKRFECYVNTETTGTLYTQNVPSLIPALPLILKLGTSMYGGVHRNFATLLFKRFDLVCWGTEFRRTWFLSCRVLICSLCEFVTEWSLKKLSVFHCCSSAPYKNISNNLCSSSIFTRIDK
jgi:hypothetical protein